MKTVKGFCYLGDRLNASGQCEVEVTARTRVGWKKFREYQEILFVKRFSLPIKGKAYKSYVRSAMLNGRKVYYLRENKVAILRKIYGEGNVWCKVGGQVDLMDMLGLIKAADKLARTNGIRWYGHVLRRPKEDVLMKEMVHKVDAKQGQPKMK